MQTMSKNIALLCCFLYLHTASQVDHHLTQNAVVLPTWNSAMMVFNEHVQATAVYRKAWTGMNAAPLAYMAHISTPLREKRAAVGFLLRNENWGKSTRTTLMLDGAYSVELVKVRIAFGLRLGVEAISSSLALLDLIDAGDEHFANNYNNILVPNAGFGIAVGNEKWSAGLSVPRLLQADVLQSIGNVEVKQRSSFSDMHTCLHAQYKWKINEMLQLQTTVFGRTVGHRLPYAQLSAVAEYKKIVGFGASYQYARSISLLASYSWLEKLRIGYSYDLPSMDAMCTFGGSHEVMLVWEFVP
jgi:type IX secretion system PorP/SprF family membrane protein